MSAIEPKRLLRLAGHFLTLGRTEEILGAASQEVIALTSAQRVLASCCLPRQRWEDGAHVEATSERVRPVAGRARSAMFAVYRRLAKERKALDLLRTGHEPMFDGLGCSTEESVHAVPVLHSTGRLWGALVVVGARAAGAEELEMIAELTAAGLANAQRLAFARRDQDRLLLLAEATDDALYDWNFQADFWWGGGILDLLGPGSEPVENSMRWKLERIHPEDLEGTRRSLDAARASLDTAWRCTYRLRRQDGTYIPVEDRCYFLRDAAGRAHRMIGSMRDMTQINDLLAREHAARTEAESANRSKDEFLALLGHELRNPLAPIVTGLQLMRMRGVEGFDRELTMLERQAHRIVRMVDDLLDISRIANKKVELKRERVEIGTIVEGAIEAAVPLIEARRHHLAVDVPAHGLEVNVDRDRLVQVIANLLTNAAKYTPPGGSIAIRGWAEGGDIAVAVRDSGIGIDPEMVPKVFTMFVQERQALDRAQGGLGLGLSIVRSLVELHGGTVGAASAGQGHGSEFTITLPAAEAAAPASESGRRPQPRSQISGRRILVVDDNEDAAEMLATLLESMGHTIHVAHDAAAALELADEHPFDLGVLDIGLPVMDGYELARALRQRFDQNLCLIALTGYGQASDRQRTAEAGFDGHLVKPIEVDALAAMIEQVCSTSATRTVTLGDDLRRST